MKNLFILIALGAAASISADYQSCTGPGCRAAQQNYNNPSQQYSNNSNYSNNPNQPYSGNPDQRYSNNPDQRYSSNPNQSYSSSYNNQDTYYSQSGTPATSTTEQQDYASNDQDKRLNDRIRAELRNWVSLRDTLIIRTTNGIVIISGTVDNPEEISKVTSKVKAIDGVKGIDNRLTVQDQ